jgi:hypothetical protein
MAGVGIPQKTSHVGRNLAIGFSSAVCLIVIAAIAIGGANSGSRRTPLAVAATASTSASAIAAGTPSAGRSDGCSPQPCASAYGLTVKISGLNRSAPAGSFFPPEAGNHMVFMQMTMHNDSASDTKSVNPFDFKLRDPAGVEHNFALSDSPGCDTWSAVELAPGASFGPKPLCFQASGDPNGKLTLLWSPDIFSPPKEIPL